MYLTLAKKLGLTTVATWHAPFIQDVKLALLGCDPRIASIVDYFFSWGRFNDQWLDAIAADTQSIRTGNPVAAKNKKLIRPESRPKKILLLQYAGTGEDYVFPQALQYDFFVHATAMLNRKTDVTVRLKVHQGPYSADYYRAVADRFGLNVEIYKEEPFQELLQWADAVIGPVASGAMLEVLGAGVPYYPVLLQPTAIDAAHFEDHPIFASVDELETALENWDQQQFDSINESFSDLGNPIPPPTRLDNGVGAGGCRHTKAVIA